MSATPRASPSRSSRAMATHLSLSFAILLLCYFIACDEDYDSMPIFDDYNEPIEQKPIEEEEEEDEDRDKDRDNDKTEEAAPNKSEPEDEDADDNEVNNDSHAQDEERPERGHRNPPITAPRPEPEPVHPHVRELLQQQKQDQQERQRHSDFRSLLVKVYRGPTKQINERPFASWGYFVKYPSEDSASSNKA